MKTINISQVIDRSSIGGLQRRVVALCALIAMLDGLDLQLMALVVPKIAGEWGLTAYSFGPALSASLAGIMLGSMSFGILGDRLGRRITLISAFVLVGAMSILTSFCDTLGALVACRFSQAWGSAAACRTSPL